MRNKKGQYSSPEDKQINSDSQELLGEYLASLQQQKRGTTQSTIDTRKREVRYWLAFCEHNELDPLAAETTDVRGYIQTITHLADTSVGSYYRSIQSFYSIVENDEANDKLQLINGHPCRDKNDIDLKNDYGIHEQEPEYKTQHALLASEIDGARDNNTDVFAVTPGTVHKLFEYVDGQSESTRLRNEAVIRLSWYTGCRAVELSRLKIENIDWNDCSINVKSAKLNVKENSDLIRRDVFFPESFKFQLKRWCERVRHAFSTTVDSEKGNILVTEQSDSMSNTHINDVIKSAAHNAGVQQPLRPPNPSENEEVKEWLITSHRLRRSAISHWVNDCPELDLHQVRRIAGHARIEQTMSYVEPDQDQLALDYQAAVRSE